DNSGAQSSDEIGQAGGDAGVQADDLAGFGSAEDFYSAQSGQLEVVQGLYTRVRLSHNSGELCGGFHQEHSGEQRLAGKVAAQEGFISADLIFTNATLARLQAHQPIQETELGAVGKAAQGGGEGIGHEMRSEAGK